MHMYVCALTYKAIEQVASTLSPHVQTGLLRARDIRTSPCSCTMSPQDDLLYLTRITETSPDFSLRVTSLLQSFKEHVARPWWRVTRAIS